MFSSTMLSTLVVVALSLRVSAHGGAAPALGVTGAFTKADVQRVVAGSDCGSTNVAATIDSSTAVPADANGTFAVTGTSFDPGADGSLQMTAVVDPTGAGKTFPGTVAISQNGNAVQTASASTQPIVAALPAGTKCSGGAAGNLCLVAFKTSAGFQNCVVVSQGAAAGNATASAGTAAANSSVSTGSVAANSTVVAASNSTGAASVSNTTSSAGTAAVAGGAPAKAKKVKKVKKVKLSAAQKAAKKAAKAAKKAKAKASKAGGAAAAGGVAAAATAPAPVASAPVAVATAPVAASKRAIGSRAARAARAGVWA